MIQISPSSSSKHSYRVLVFLYFTSLDTREEKCSGIPANFIQSGQRTPVFCLVWWSLLHAERREAFSWNFNPSGCQQFCHLDQILWLICDSLFSPMIIICGFFSEWINLLLLLLFLRMSENCEKCQSVFLQSTSWRPQTPLLSTTTNKNIQFTVRGEETRTTVNS